MNNYFTEYENLEVKPVFGWHSCILFLIFPFNQTGTRAYAKRSTTTRSVLQCYIEKQGSI